MTPNLSSGLFYLKYNLADRGVVFVEITDVAGKIIRTIEPSSNSQGQHEKIIDLKAAAEGIYFLKFKLNSATLVKRLTFAK